jgi:hypothetical protein
MSPARRLLVTGLVTGISDCLFATVQSVIVNHSAARVWQGVASTLLGASAIGGGTRTVAIGLLMHFGVAFFWSAVFILGVMRLGAIRAMVESPAGILVVAAVYGPLIWLVMSFGVIPLLVHRPPSITLRWWTQLIGHVIFVGLPIAGCSAATSDNS